MLLRHMVNKGGQRRALLSVALMLDLTSAFAKVFGNML